MISLKTIKRACKNAGGVRRFWIVAACDLPEDLANTDCVLDNQSPAALPSVFVQHRQEPGTAVYDENWEVSKMGIAPRKQLFQYFINKSDGERLKEMDKLRRARGFVLVIQDNNGLLRLMGTKRHPARLDGIKMSTGADLGSQHGYTVSFSAYPVPEPYFLPLPVEPPIVPLNDRNRETIHFRGDFRQRAIQFTDIMYELEVVNIFDALLNIRYQFSQEATPDWSNDLLHPILNFSQMENLALNAAAPFWINFLAEGYTTGSDGFLLFNYRGPSTGGPMVLTYTGLSQDQYIGFREKVALGTPTLSAGLGAFYNVLSSPAQSFVEYPLTTIAAVNAAITALPAGIGYVVGVYANYAGATTSGTITIPITYL